MGNDGEDHEWSFQKARDILFLGIGSSYLGVCLVIIHRTAHFCVFFCMCVTRIFHNKKDLKRSQCVMQLFYFYFYFLVKLLRVLPLVWTA